MELNFLSDSHQRNNTQSYQFMTKSRSFSLSHYIFQLVYEKGHNAESSYLKYEAFFSKVFGVIVTKAQSTIPMVVLSGLLRLCFSLTPTSL